MLRRIIFLLCALVLAGCTLAPEDTTVPKTVCPACPTAITCPTCAAASTCTQAPPPTVTPVPPSTSTSVPSSTPEATATLEATATPVPTATSSVPMFSLQPGTPALLQNFAHPAQACKWMGVAGQVLAADGSPVIQIVVEVAGMMGDLPVDLVGMTGSVLDYGEGGYEILLSDKPIATSGTLTIQLFDLDGIPLSNLILFDTSKDCAKNLILVNFTETRLPQQ